MVNISDVVDVQGTESPESKVPGISDIKKWLLRDLQGAIGMLSAIRDDVELQDQMAEWMHGRYVNFLNRPKQEPNGKPV